MKANFGEKTERYRQSYLRSISENPVGNDFIESDIITLRQNANNFFTPLCGTELLPDVNKEALYLSNHDRKTKISYYTPHDMRNENEIIIFYPGGGLALDMSELHTTICAKIAKHSSTRLACIQSVLAPEFKHDVILEDAYNASYVVFKNSSASKCVVAGYSMGANIATLIALKSLSDANFVVSSQALISGRYDLSLETSLDTHYQEQTDQDFMAPKSQQHFFNSLYLSKKEKNLKAPHLSPLFADLKKLPPSLLITGEYDALMPESLAYHHALKNAGVDSSLIINPGHIHNTTLLFDKCLGDGQDPALQLANNI